MTEITEVACPECGHPLVNHAELATMTAERDRYKATLEDARIAISDDRSDQALIIINAALKKVVK